MATVDGLTKARMLAIEAASVVDGEVVGDNLILERFDGSTIDAGDVRGPQGIQGPAGTNGTNGTNGTSYTPHTAGLVSGSAVAASSGGWTRLTGLVVDANYPTIGSKVGNGGAIIRVTETGLYLVFGAITFGANATGRRGIAFDANASPSAAYANVQHGQVVATSSSTPTVAASNPLYCQANDYIRLWAFQDSGASINVGGSSTTYIKVVKQ